MARNATGAALAQIVQTLYSARQKGLVTKGKLVLDPVATKATANASLVRVSIKDCADSSHWLLYKKSGARADSFIWTVGHDSSRSDPRIPVAGQVIVHQYSDRRVHDTYWVQRTDGPLPNPGAYTVRAPSAARVHWQLTAVEIRPATS